MVYQIIFSQFTFRNANCIIESILQLSFSMTHLYPALCVHGLPLSLQESPQTHSPLTDLESNKKQKDKEIKTLKIFNLETYLQVLISKPIGKSNINKLKQG